MRLRKFKGVAAEKALLQGNDRVVVDVYGESDGIRIFEIEEKRRAPLQNVAKILKWVSRSRSNTRVKMIQVFSQEFYGKERHRAEAELARFIGDMGQKLLK